MAIAIEMTQFRRVVASPDELRAIYGEPSERAVLKEHAHLDGYSQAFIARSPFVLLATCGASGRCDVSPKGDAPGFAKVLDETTLVIPDRKGNRRIDSLINIVENPHVGLLFLIPGSDETLRVNGRAAIVQDDGLLERLAVDGKRPLTVIVVSVEEVYLHYARAFLRSKLWDPTQHMDRNELPSLARMILDVARPPGRTEEEHERLVAEADAVTCEAYQNLY
jgi:PPOX class probable FMN-dependent enzyme